MSTGDGWTPTCFCGHPADPPTEEATPSTYATRQRRKKSDATFDLQQQLDLPIPAISDEQARSMLGLRGAS